jgi:hypothetical protein
MFNCFIDNGQFVTTLTLGSRPKQGHGMVWAKMQPRSHIHTFGSVRKCEGMSPHTPKWTPTLGIGVPMDFQIFKEQLEESKLIGLKTSLYYWKAFKM